MSWKVFTSMVKLAERHIALAGNVITEGSRFMLPLSDLEGSWSESRALCSSALIAARVVEAPEIVGASSEGSYKLDFRKVVRDDVYYSFSLGSDLFLAKRDGDIVKVFEVLRDGDEVLAFPIYEVEVG
jgi:S1-C subfamily serine protease